MPPAIDDASDSGQGTPVRGGPWGTRRRGCHVDALEKLPRRPQIRGMPRDSALRNSIVTACCFIAVLWNLHLLEFIFGLDLHRLGVYPREVSGLTGVLTAPLVHGSWSHLFSNTLPLLLLGSMLLYGYPRSRWWALITIWLVSGLGVWLFARSSFHFGASGITHGMFFFLFTAGILRRDRRSAALLMIAFYMYGGMVLSIFPGEPGISFEYHAFGALGGLIAALVFRKRDPKPRRRSYEWEAQGSDEEDPVIGDQWKLDRD